MARFVSTTFGTISGRHGSAVATTTKNGQSILRVFNAPSNPKTEAQMTQRTKFALVNKELSYMNDLFKISFHSNSGKNKAVSLALRNAVTGTYPNFSIDYSNLTIASGKLQITDQLSINTTTGTSVKVDWDSTIGTESTSDDVVNLVFLNTLSKVVLLKQATAVRSEGTVDVELPSAWAGASIHSWIYFSNTDTSATSNSQYLSLLQL